jgi:hypothetical protein
MLAQVVNHCQGPHYIQGQNLDGKKPPLLILRPGLNLVPSKQVSDWRKANAAFDGLFKTKIKPSRQETADPTKFGKPMLEVVGKELDPVNPFAKLSVEEIEGVVSMTTNTDLIAEWMKSAKQGDAVTKILNDRVKELAASFAAG